MSQSERKNQTFLKGLPKLQPIQQLKFRANSYLVTGTAFIVVSVIILLSIFSSLLKAELSYFFSGNKNVRVVGKSEAMISIEGSNNFEIVRPVDENFGIVIPKIGVNSKVIPDVDPENSAIYQKALTQGAAHALGAKYPGEEGNVFIFAHSGQNFLEANRYNAVFYLLTKLEAGDEVFLFYKNKKYRYLVMAKATAFPEEIHYLADTPGKHTLTLMTCWPGGTTWKRLIVQAEQK